MDAAKRTFSIFYIQIHKIAIVRIRMQQHDFIIIIILLLIWRELNLVSIIAVSYPW